MPKMYVPFTAAPSLGESSAGGTASARRRLEEIAETQERDAPLPRRGLDARTVRFSFCTHKDMESPAIVEKYKQGPVGMRTLFPSGPPVMAKFLGLWFVYCLIIGFFVAYLTAHTVAPGGTYPAAFRVAGSAAFMAYGLGSLSNSIWKASLGR
jgi:hypothetical protein